MNIKEIKAVSKYKPYYGLGMLTLQLLAMLLFNNTVVGLVMLLWLFVPCGIKIINQNKLLWFIRQLVFLTVSLSLIFF